ncbi:DUF5709 domain-containing protein [Pilimelia columellifera]|uniref:DUF5709 domain-containing protein n=1 Tax=Pilimelia columellifera TaxID=706574 RepID=UPI003CD09584
MSEPQADGLPDTADHDSTAYDDIHSAREADGPRPAALPVDHAVRLDAFGGTPAEARAGTPLDQRLAQEQPDQLLTGPDARWDDEERPDHDVLDPSPRFDPSNPVSMYDRPLDDGDVAPIGRLAAPDAGSGFDEEKDEVARDMGPSGGGPTVEEAAMHETHELD